jgi:GNAT superfamily N-acetyltransferase
MAGSSFLYRMGKTLVDLLPERLLRCRPFGVYEIQLPKSVDQSATKTAPDFVCQVRWVVNDAEAAQLRPLAGADNIAALDFTTRRAAAAWQDGQLVGCAWIATERFEERALGLRFELQNGEAWLFAAMVDPLRRNHGVYRQLLEFLIRELGAEGLRRILLGVTAGNEPSRRAHARQGAVEIGAIFAICSFGVTLVGCRGGVRRLSRLPASWGQPIRLAVEP